jgi:hypothetical protein
MYEVLEGEAFYLLQRAQNEDTVDEVILVKAIRGDKVTAPTSRQSRSHGPESHFESQSGTACARTDSYYCQFLLRLCQQQEVYRHHRDCRTGVGLGVMAYFEFDKADSSNPKSETLRFDFDIDSIQQKSPTPQVMRPQSPLGNRVRR